MTRDHTATRLLNGSVKRSYDPDVDLDWDAPLVEGRYFIPPETVTLYGTPIWERMSEEQRIELSRQEMANTLSVGIWFENILNQMLLRMAYSMDPTRPHVHYALTEMADECRHMTMFGKLIDRVGAKPYRRGLLLRNLGRILPLILRGPSVWVAALVGEEIFDALQRELMRDPALQPLSREVMRIHVAEESRHIRYAREDLARRMTEASWAKREFARLVAGIGSLLLKRVLVRPEVYRRAGLEPRSAYRAAMANPHATRMFARGFEKLRSFLDDQGLIGGPTRVFWRLAKVHPDGLGA